MLCCQAIVDNLQSRIAETQFKQYNYPEILSTRQTDASSLFLVPYYYNAKQPHTNMPTCLTNVPHSHGCEHELIEILAVIKLFVTAFHTLPLFNQIVQCHKHATLVSQCTCPTSRNSQRRNIKENSLLLLYIFYVIILNSGTWQSTNAHVHRHINTHSTHTCNVRKK